MMHIQILLWLVIYVYFELRYFVFCSCNHEKIICGKDLKIFTFVVGFVLCGLLARERRDKSNALTSFSVI